MILKINVKLADMEAIDADFHRSLVWMLYFLSFTLLTYSENDIEEALDLTFSTEDDRFGEVVTVDLKPDGQNIPVTNENKKEYVEYGLPILY
jgi:E3 ubiquitin-protein ligase NEDD4